MIIETILKQKSDVLISLRQEDTVQTAATLLTTNKIGALPVRDKDHALIGIISERDIVKGVYMHGGDVSSLQVRELMTTNVSTCGLDDDVTDVQQRMHNNRFRHMPVVEGGKLVGVISQGDVVHLCLEQSKLEANVMRDLAFARG